MVTLLVSIELTPEPVKSRHLLENHVSPRELWFCTNTKAQRRLHHEPARTASSLFLPPYSAPVTHTNVPHHVTTYISLFFLSIYVWKKLVSKGNSCKVKGINIYKICEMWMQTIFNQIMFKILINWSLILINVYPKINANKQSECI